MLGASVLTLVEFIDLIAFIVYHQILRLTRVRKKKKEENEHLKMREVNGNGAREGQFADFWVKNDGQCQFVWEILFW